MVGEKLRVVEHPVMVDDWIRSNRERRMQATGELFPIGSGQQGVAIRPQDVAGDPSRHDPLDVGLTVAGEAPQGGGGQL